MLEITVKEIKGFCPVNKKGDYKEGKIGLYFLIILLFTRYYHELYINYTCKE